MQNAKLIVLFRFFWMFIPVVSVFVPLLSSLQFTMTEFFLIQSCFSLAVVVVEIPSGYFADLYGRKTTLIIASVLSGIGFTYLYFAKELWQFYIYELIIGSSMAMATGTDFAILFDSVTEDLKDPETKKFKFDQKTVTAQTSYWSSSFQSGAMLGESLSAFIGGVLAFYNISYNLIATGIAGWFPLAVTFFLKEPEIKRMNKKSHLENFKMIIREMFYNSRLLRLLLLNFLIWSIATLSAVWMVQKYWTDHNISLFYVGCMWSILSLISFGFSRFAFQIEYVIGLKNSLLVFSLFVVSICVLLPFVGFATSIFIVSFIYMARGVQSVIYREELNIRLGEEIRATANSIFSLLFRFVFMVLGPLLGAFIDLNGVKYLFPIMGLLFLALFFISLVPFLNEIEKTGNNHY
jgi:MFS family permease